MKKLIIGAIAVLLPLSAIGQNERIDRIVSRVRVNKDFSAVTPAVRDEVIEKIREYSGDSFAETTGKNRADYFLLVRLGDVEATRQVVEAMKAKLPEPDRGWPFLWILGDNAQPVIIPLIAKDFFQNDGETQTAAGSGDIAYMVLPAAPADAGADAAMVAGKRGPLLSAWLPGRATGANASASY